METEPQPAITPEPITPTPDAAVQTELTLSQIVEGITRMPPRETITFKEFLDLFGEQSIYVTVLACSLPVAIPFIGLDIFMALLGLPLCIIGYSMIVGAHRMWLPKWAATKEFSYPKAIRILKVFNTGLDYAERLLKPRLPQLVSGNGERAAGAVLIALSLCYFFFSGYESFSKDYIPTAIFFIALALIMRDGFLMCGAYILSLLCFILTGEA